MQKKILFFLTLLVLAFVISPVSLFAEEETQVSIEPTQASEQTDKNSQFKKSREEMEVRRRAMMEDKKVLKENIKTTITQERENFKAEIKMKREEGMEKMKEKREEFKTKIAEIKDTRKKAIVERVDNKIGTLNKVRTDHLAAVLEKLTSIVDRVEEKTAAKKEEGKDTAGVESAITAARSAIEIAKTAVASQAAKEYVIDVSEEDQLKTDTQTTVKTVQADLKTTRESVTQAKEAVHNIFKEIAKIEDNSTTPSPSPTAAP